LISLYANLPETARVSASKPDDIDLAKQLEFIEDLIDNVVLKY